MSRSVLARAAAVVVVAGASWLAWSEWQENRVPAGPPREAGRILFTWKRCVRCHRIAGVGGLMGPDLTAVAVKRAPSWLEAYISDPRAIKADARMPKPKLNDAQRAAVLAYLATLDGTSPPEPPTP